MHMKVSVITYIYLLVVELLILYFVHNQRSTRGTEGGGWITLVEEIPVSQN